MGLQGGLRNGIPQFRRGQRKEASGIRTRKTFACPLTLPLQSVINAYGVCACKSLLKSQVLDATPAEDSLRFDVIG